MLKPVSCIGSGSKQICLCFPDLQKQDQNKHERKMRIAKEFSDLIVYCRAVPFREESKFRLTYIKLNHPAF